MGNGNRVEMFIAICAVISSIAAVYIAWDQGRVMRAQQHGEVFPILQVDGYFSNTNEFSELGIKVSNRGVGPALIESVVLEIDGERVDSLHSRLAELPGNYDTSWESITGRALAPGQTATPLDMRWRKEDASVERLSAVAASAASWRLKICYCSVFERCWQTERLGNARAERVARCERAETDIFNDLGARNLDNNANAFSPSENPSPDGATQ